MGITLNNKDRSSLSSLSYKKGDVVGFFVLKTKNIDTLGRYLKRFGGITHHVVVVMECAGVNINNTISVNLYKYEAGDSEIDLVDLKEDTEDQIIKEAQEIFKMTAATAASSVPRSQPLKRFASVGGAPTAAVASSGASRPAIRLSVGSPSTRLTTEPVPRRADGNKRAVNFQLLFEGDHNIFDPIRTNSNSTNSTLLISKSVITDDGPKQLFEYYCKYYIYKNSDDKPNNITEYNIDTRDIRKSINSIIRDINDKDMISLGTKGGSEHGTGKGAELSDDHDKVFLIKYPPNVDKSEYDKVEEAAKSAFSDLNKAMDSLGKKVLKINQEVEGLEEKLNETNKLKELYKLAAREGLDKKSFDIYENKVIQENKVVNTAANNIHPQKLEGEAERITDLLRNVSDNRVRRAWRNRSIQELGGETAAQNLLQAINERLVEQRPPLLQLMKDKITPYVRRRKEARATGDYMKKFRDYNKKKARLLLLDNMKDSNSNNKLTMDNIDGLLCYAPVGCSPDNNYHVLSYNCRDYVNGVINELKNTLGEINLEPISVGKIKDLKRPGARAAAAAPARELPPPPSHGRPMVSRPIGSPRLATRSTVSEKSVIKRLDPLGNP